jgi:predicted neuraminidase
MAWLAMANKSDNWHARALARYEGLFLAGRRFVTTSAVLWEVGNGLSPPLLRAAAVALYDRLCASARVFIGCNVMEVNFLRLTHGDIALFHCQKNTESTDCRVMMRTSRDEGKTWTPARQLSPENKYTGLTNGRCIRLRTGRLLLEAWEGGDSYGCLSDDDGQTWRDSQRVRPAQGECWEPACVELKDGRVMMLLRTGLGGQYKSLSEDGGETWSEPVPTPLVGTAAPVSLSRIPTTGDLLAIWNHNPGANQRNPLTAAVSKDEGETWERFKNLEDAPDDAWAYPAVTWVDNRALITYFNYKGGLSLKLRSLPAAWFYE